MTQRLPTIQSTFDRFDFHLLHAGIEAALADLSGPAARRRVIEALAELQRQWSEAGGAGHFLAAEWPRSDSGQCSNERSTQRFRHPLVFASRFGSQGSLSLLFKAGCPLRIRISETYCPHCASVAAAAGLDWALGEIIDALRPLPDFKDAAALALASWAEGVASSFSVPCAERFAETASELLFDQPLPPAQAGVFESGLSRLIQNPRKREDGSVDEASARTILSLLLAQGASLWAHETEMPSTEIGRLVADGDWSEENPFTFMECAVDSGSAWAVDLLLAAGFELPSSERIAKLRARADPESSPAAARACLALNELRILDADRPAALAPTRSSPL